MENIDNILKDLKEAYTDIIEGKTYKPYFLMTSEEFGAQEDAIEHIGNALHELRKAQRAIKKLEEIAKAEG